jgi:hypothetical protein
MFLHKKIKHNSAAVKQYQESLSPNGKAQVLVKHATNKNIDNLFHLKTIKIIISICHAAAANAPLLPLPPPRCRRISKCAAATAKIALPPS